MANTDNTNADNFTAAIAKLNKLGKAVQLAGNAFYDFSNANADWKAELKDFRLDKATKLPLMAIYLGGLNTWTWLKVVNTKGYWKCGACLDKESAIAYLEENAVEAN